MAASDTFSALGGFCLAFYSDQIQPLIRLTARHPTATVTIRLGPKAGVLVGRATDAVAGAPLNLYVEFRSTYQPDCFLVSGPSEGRAY